MSVQVFCIKCDRSCRVPEEHVGRRVRCPGCQEVFKAEQPPLADSTADDAIQVFCPKCDRAGRVSAELLGRRVRCAGCQEAYKAEDVPVAALDDETSATEGKRLESSSATSVSKSASDSAVRSGNPPPPPLPRAPQSKPIVEELPCDRTEEKQKRTSRADEEEESDSRRGSRRRDERDERDDDDYEDRRDKRRSRDDEKPRSKKDAPLLEVGRVDNPFVDSSTLLTSTEVDQSVFEFDWGDEPESNREKDRDRSEKKKKPSESRDRDDRDSRDRRTEERPSGRSKKDSPDTEYAWDEKKSPPDELPSESSVAKGKKKSQPVVDDSSPFSFDPGAEDPTPRSQDSKGRLSGTRKDEARRDRGKEERSRESRDEHKKEAPRKPVKRIEDDAASFLGLSDMEPAADEEKETGDPDADRAFFHLRQTGFWDEARLFRVFVGNDEIIFIEAATGKDIPDMEEALRADSLDAFDKRLRRRVLDLNELSVDELRESDSSFVWSVGKIIDASIDPPAAKPAGGGRRSAVLQLVHKTKGTVAFDLPFDSDVESALKILPEPFEDILQVRVRWDKASKRFVKQ